MQAGWFEEDNIVLLLEKMDVDARVEGLRQAIQAPWSIIYGSFDDNIADVVEALSQTALTHCAHMSPGQITDRARVLEDFGYSPVAEEVMQRYIDTINTLATEDVRSLSGSDAEPSRAHPAIKAAIAQKISNDIQAVDLKDTLLKIGSRGAWSNEQIDFLAALPPSRYVEIVKALRDQEITTAVYAALNFGRFQEAKYSMIASNMRQALMQIGAESKLNRFRVAKFLRADGDTG